MKRPIFRLLFLLIILAALATRAVKLDLRPMHHDEANQAVKFAGLLEDGDYTYDREDHHGPSLYYLSLPLVRLITGPKFANTTAFVLRLLPALFGVGIIIFLLFLSDALGGRAVLLSAILIALSPLMVFYSRFYIQEILLVFFSIGAAVSGWRYYRNPNTGWAVLTGFFGGMMYATKETCLIIFAAFFAALILTRITSRKIKNPGRNAAPAVKQCHFRARHILAAAAAALLVIILFYSSFFKNPAGILDSLPAFKTYIKRASEAGFHQHPWYYYLKMLAYSKYGNGPAWSEGLVLVLAILGSAALFRKKIKGNISSVFLSFVFFYTLITTAIFSFLPYKTPWNILPFYWGMLLLAGVGGSVIFDFFPFPVNRKNIYRVAVGGVFLAGVIQFGSQSLCANFKYYADNRNPYVYAHTVTDFKRLVSRIEDIAALHPDHDDMLIKVIANSYDTWPLPWYLRRFRSVDYRQDTATAGSLHEVPLILASLEQEKKIRSALKKEYQYEYYGLRPEVLLVVYIRPDLWQEFMKSRMHRETSRGIQKN